MQLLLSLVFLAATASAISVKPQAIFPYGNYRNTKALPVKLLIRLSDTDYETYVLHEAWAAQPIGTSSVEEQLVVTLAISDIEHQLKQPLNITLTGFAFKTCCGPDKQELASFSWEIRKESGTYDINLEALKIQCETPRTFSSVDLYKTEPPTTDSPDHETLVVINQFCGALGSVAFACDSNFPGHCYAPPSSD